MVAAREQGLAERFLEDERLRGVLDDATWQPLQDWLLRAAHTVAAATADLNDALAEELLDEGSSQAREIARVLADLLGDGEVPGPYDLEDLLHPPLFDEGRAIQAQRALGRIAAQPWGEIGPDLAEAVTRALEPS